MTKRIIISTLLSSIISCAVVALYFILSETHESNMTYIFRALLVALFVTVISSVLFSLLVSKTISRNINAIDAEHPSCHDTYEELSPLITHLATNKRSVDRRLKDAERRAEEFRLITENMSEGLVTVDEAGSILSYNSAALRLLKIHNPKGKNILSFNRTHEFREVVFSALAGSRAENEMTLDTKTYSLIASPVFDEKKVIGAIIIVLDISEAHRQEQLRREFTSNVSHELKTPLTSISGFAEIMKSDTTDSETVADFSASIYDEAQRLITLVSDIIKLSELDEATIEFPREDVGLRALSEEILTRLMPSAERCGVSLSLEGEDAYVFGTRKILDEMIYNLCDNAIKYSNRGGSVSVLIQCTDEEVSLTVSDDGIGIPESEQGRIFERFYRVDKSHSREVGGTGLGLSIVKHGAIYHNAEIELSSEIGTGTSIKIIFAK